MSCELGNDEDDSINISNHPCTLADRATHDSPAALQGLPQLPPRCGIRIPAMKGELAARFSIRTVSKQGPDGEADDERAAPNPEGWPSGPLFDLGRRW